MAISTRPFAASMRGVNVAVTPPCRMNVPSCAIRARSSAGLNVTVKVITDSRDALLIDTGTVYGPPATWKIVPGVVTTICAGVAGGGGAPPRRPGGGGGGGGGR